MTSSPEPIHGSDAVRATRDAILDAAAELLGRLGYRKTTLDDLAREAGVGRRTIYLHFASKEEVFLSTIDRVVEQVLLELEAIAGTQREAADKIRDMLAARILVRFDAVRGYWRSLSEMLADLRPSYLERRERMFEREAAVFARVVRTGIRDGSLGRAKPLEVGRALVLATNALLLYSLSERDLGSREEVKRDIQRITELVLSGLIARHVGERGPKKTAKV